MTQTVCITYQPGGYGSFVSWMIDRYARQRRLHDPIIIDNPLLPDGSSHGYVSYCKLVNDNEWMRGLEHARNDDTPWHYNIYAGWPNKNINTAISETLAWMDRSDKMIVIETGTTSMHLLRWLRNETTMSQSRWWQMIDVDSEDQLENRLLDDIRNTELVLASTDQRLLVVSINDIVFGDSMQLMFAIMNRFLEWHTVDVKHFVDIHSQMKRMQLPYIAALDDIKNGIATTPVQKLILDLYNRKEIEWI